MNQRNVIGCNFEFTLKKKRLTLAVLSALSMNCSIAQAFPIGDEFQVNTYTTNIQANSDVAMSSDGSFVVVWDGDDKDGNLKGVFAQRFDALGNPVGAEINVNTFTTFRQENPAVAMDDEGNFVVVWSSNFQDGTPNSIYAQQFQSDGVPVGTEFRVNTYTTSGQGASSVSMDEDGDFVVVWTSFGQDGANNGIFGQRFDSSGTPNGAEFQANTETAGDQRAPAVSSDQLGNFVVVWEVDPFVGSNPIDIKGQRYSANGMSLGSEFTVNTFSTLEQTMPDVSVNADGEFVVVWQSFLQDGNSFGVYGLKYDALGMPVAGEFQVNSYTTSSQQIASVAIEQDGSFVVTWTGNSQDGSANGVFGKRFNSNAEAIGGEIFINSFTTGTQSDSAVAIDGDGDFIVTWTDYVQDGYSAGIFAQRYLENTTRSDFSADKKSDLLWRNSVTGSNLEWLLDGNTNTPQGLPPVSTAWEVVAVGDVNLDGYADVVWGNQTDGRNVMWQLQNNIITKIVSLPQVADLNWQVVAMGDTNGDGTNDILWRHQTDGRNALWQVNDTSVVSANLGTVADTDWIVGGMGDGDGDGKADIFWRHQTDGRTSLWLMDGFDYSIGNLLTVGDTNWQVQGLGDTNGDGRDDVVWRHQLDGRNVIWQLDGYNAPVSDFTNQLANLDWTMQQIGDADGDGKADIVWRNTTDGRNVLWTLDGFSATQTSMTTVGNIDWDIEPD